MSTIEKTAPSSTDHVDMLAYVDEFAQFLLDSDETKCEYGGGHPANLPCTGEVTYRVSSCRQQGNVCSNAAEDVRWRMATSTCDGCNKKAEKCWKIRVI